MLKTTTALLLLTCPLSAGELLLPDKQESKAFQISDAALLQRYSQADENCRGLSPNELDMYLGCAAREVYLSVLINRNYCYGKQEDEGASQMYWHLCQENSLRH